MDKDGFTPYTKKTDDSYEHIAENVKIRFHTSNMNQIKHFLKQKRKK